MSSSESSPLPPGWHTCSGSRQDFRTFSLNHKTLEPFRHPGLNAARRPSFTRIIALGAFAFVLSQLVLTQPAKSERPNVTMPGSNPAGEAIFMREWTPVVIKQIPFRDLPSIRFVRRGKATNTALKEETQGDGLGPMHNATSCEACHAVGGSSGVDRNVMMLTLDPRSAILSDLAKPVDPSDDSDRSLRHSHLDKLRQLYPGLVGLVNEINTDIVIHEKSTVHPGLFQAKRERVFSATVGASPQWIDRTQRTSEAIAQSPVLAGRDGDIDFYLSQRNAPPLYGLRYLDQVRNPVLIQEAIRQEDSSRGRITGRLPAGRFGWRGQSPSLESFVRSACAGELGLQVSDTAQAPYASDRNRLSFGNDLSDVQVRLLTSYIRTLKRPVQLTGVGNKQVISGKAIFQSVGCAQCHVENMKPAKGLYSDLLLHDMGDLLQAPSPAPDPLGRGGMRLAPSFTGRGRGRLDSPEAAEQGSRRFAAAAIRSSSMSYYGSSNSTVIPKPYAFDRPAEPQFPYGKLPDDEIQKHSKGDWVENGVAAPIPWDVLQREWRTPPLWGIADSAPYLHDGRAKTLHEAILWHGGESEYVINNYRSLDRSDREQLLTFLRSLRAPHAPRAIGLAKTPLKSMPVALAAAAKSIAKRDAQKIDQVKGSDKLSDGTGVFDVFADSY